MSAAQRVVIAGGSGAIGQALARRLSESGSEVIILSRHPKPGSPFRQIQWDGLTPDPAWGNVLGGAVLINLAGELVDRIPTKKNIDLLTSSRVQPTRALAMAARQFGAPRLWLQMSTLAIYGDAGDVLLDESAPAADGPRQMAGVAKAWEAEVLPTDAERVVWLRTAVVLQRNTPALNRLVTITKMFLGGRVGSGRQWVSWIHERDFLNAIEFVVGAGGGVGSILSGPVHLTSPQPVRNSELMATLRRVIGRPWSPPIPAIGIKIGATMLFRTDPQLALTGRRATPKKLLDAGFQFEFPQLGAALRDLT